MSVKIVPVPGSTDTTMPPWYRRFDASWWQDWAGVLFPTKHNWSDFTVILLAGEIEWHMSNAELDLALFGLHLRLTYYWTSPKRDELVRVMEGVKSGKIKTHPFSDLHDLGINEFTVVEAEPPEEPRP